MKKNIFFIAAVTFSAFLSGCFQPVLPMIREEVTLETAVVNGTINSIVRYTGKYGGETGDYLFIQNGYIAYKPASADSQRHGEWENAPYSPPQLEYDIYTDTFSGAQIIKLAVGGDGSGNNTLFALGVDYKTETGSTVPSDKILYKLIDDEWKEIYRRSIDKPTNSSKHDDNFTIFCTNSPNPKHRRAFARIGTGENRESNKYFELKANSDWSDGESLDEYGVPKTGEKSDIPAGTYNSVLFIKNDVFFTTGFASGTNETATSDATYAYWSDGGTFHWCDASSVSGNTLTSKGSLDVVNTVFSSMAVNKDSVIVGPDRSDVKRIGLDENGKPTAFINFETNATSQLRSPYTTNVLFALDASKNEKENVIYASLILRGSESSTSGSVQAVGLWSYYPERGNWNRE